MIGNCQGLQPKALPSHMAASDDKLYRHCRKARRQSERMCKAVTAIIG